MDKDQVTTALFVGPSSELKDHSFGSIIRAMAKHVANGHTVYLKWTCAGCGQRLGSEEPNAVHRYMKCEECGTVTDLAQKGAKPNYMLEMRNQSLADLEKYLKEVK